MGNVLKTAKYGIYRQEMPHTKCPIRRCETVWSYATHPCDFRTSGLPDFRTASIIPLMHLLKPGQHLAGYEILAFVAKGGMGEVYRARQVAMDRVVALKVLSPHLAKRDPVFVRRFVAEARAAGRLNHANIVRVHDVDRARIDTAQGPLDVDCFAMEFVEGETVKDVIAQYGICPIRLVVKVMQGMAEALVYAQQQGLVHRDIKPENIMLAHDGEVKLADLGLAMQAGGDESVGVAGASAGTSAGKVVGTPAYMSPEQACALPVDHRSDQYSLGATLYHMLTGEPPYGAGDSRAVMRAHVFDPVPDPQALRPDLPEGWCRLCRRLLAKEPAGRFADSEALRAAVAVLAEGGQVDASGTPVSPWRVPWRVAGVVSGILIVLAVTAWLAPRSSGGTPVATQAPEDRMAAALAALPPDDATARLALIDRLMADPANAEAQALLAKLRSDCVAILAQDDAARRQRAAEDALRRRGEERLATIRNDLATGHLASARRGLAELGDLPTGLTTQSQDLRAACERMETERRQDLETRIERANEAALPVLDGAIAGSELADVERAALSARLATRRDALQRQASARQAEIQMSAWRSVAQAWEARRGEAFDPLDVAAPWRSQLDTGDRRLAFDLLASAASALPRIDAALGRWIAANRPEADVVAEGRRVHVRLLRWDASQAQIQEGTVASAAEPRMVPRRRLTLALAPLVARALAQARSDGVPVGDSPRALAVHLWCCRAVDAAPAIAALGDDAVLALLIGSEALLPVKPFALAVGPALAADGLLAPGGIVTYGGGQAWSGLLADFVGLTAQPQDDAWRLQATGAVPRPVAEATLPTWAWRGHLRAPAVVEARVRMAADVPSVLVGFRSATRAARIGVRPCDRSQGWLRTGNDTITALGTAPWMLRPDGLVTLRLSVEADGSASASIDGLAARPLKQSGLAGDVIIPIIQAVTDAKHPSAMVEVLSFSVEAGR
jgi:serine/threonine protein kinase